MQMFAYEEKDGRTGKQFRNQRRRVLTHTDCDSHTMPVCLEPYFNIWHQ